MLVNSFDSALNIIDSDPEETVEWRDAFHSLLEAGGVQRAVFMLEDLQRLARSARQRRLW